MIPRDTEAFFALKQAIDDEIARLGWTKERYIVYIKDRYYVRSRLAMTDEQLRHLLKTLSSMATPNISQTTEKNFDSRMNTARRRDRRKRR